MAETDTTAAAEATTTSGRLPDGELDTAYIGDPDNAATLREHVLDVSNTQYQSGTGRTPVKATVSEREVEEARLARNAPVVVAPDPSGLPENRELASLSPGHHPDEMRAMAAGRKAESAAGPGDATGLEKAGGVETGDEDLSGGPDPAAAPRSGSPGALGPI